MRHTFLAAVLWAMPIALSAQQDSARLIGTVTSLAGAPLSGVLVSLPDEGWSHTTDSTGRFEHPTTRLGWRTLRVAVIGLAPEEHDVRLQAGRTTAITVLVDPAAIELAPIVVIGEHEEGSLRIAGFYARRQRALYGGRYFTHADIMRRAPDALSGLLAATGLTMRCGLVGGGCVPVRVDRCIVPVYLDGMRVPSRELDRIPPSMVAGVEVYRSSFDTPLEYAVQGGSCGAILVWTGF